MPDEPRKHITEALGGQFIPPMSHDERKERERVRNLMQREVARAAPEDHGREPAPDNAIDARLATAQRIAASGIAPAHGITAPNTPSGVPSQDPTRPSPGNTLDR